jgi:hypothetical protein
MKSPGTPRSYLVHLSVILALLAAHSHAAVVTFKEGAASPFGGGVYHGTEDNTLILQGGNTFDNWGGRQTLQIGYSGADARKDLLRFNVSSLAGEYLSIESVQLRLYVNLAPALGEADLVNVFRVSTANGDWVEGTAGNGGQTGSSCWGWKQYSSLSWAGSAGLGTAGIDYVTGVAASHTLGSTDVAGSALTFTFADVSFLSGWIAGNNPGLVLAGTATAVKSIWPAFWSSEAASIGGAGFEPELIVTYTPTPEPAALSLLTLGAFSLLAASRRRR